MRTCQSCGLQNPPDRDFCECGEYLRWEPTGYVQVELAELEGELDAHRQTDVRHLVGVAIVDLLDDTRDVGQQVLDDVFAKMQIDQEWSVREARSFAWWGHDLAQRVWVEPAFLMAWASSSTTSDQRGLSSQGCRRARP